MTDNRIHSKRLAKVREHIDTASQLVRAATLAPTAAQEEAIAAALPALRAAIQLLEEETQ